MWFSGGPDIPPENGAGPGAVPGLGPLRSIATTSPPEVGTDRPELNPGTNNGLRPTGEQFHEHVDRLGRGHPAHVVIPGDRDIFQRHPEALMDCYSNSVRESRLCLDHLYMAWEYALSPQRQEQTGPGKRP